MSEVGGSEVEASAVEGGCFCGGLRYRIAGEPRDAAYCHCRMCQRSVGAPVVAWGTWPAERFAWTKGEPHLLASSPHGERFFCRDCGTQLLFRDPTEPEAVDVNLVTLDDPARFPPTYHIWTDSHVAWFEIGDELPQYPEGGAVTAAAAAAEKV